MGIAFALAGAFGVSSAHAYGVGFQPLERNLEGNLPAAGNYLVLSTTFVLTVTPSIPSNIGFTVRSTGLPAGFNGTVQDAEGYVSVVGGPITNTIINGDDVGTMDITVTLRIPHLDLPVGAAPKFTYQITTTGLPGGVAYSCNINASTTLPPPSTNPVPPTIVFIRPPTPTDNFTYSYGLGQAQAPVVLQCQASADALYPINGIDLTITGVSPNGFALSVPAFSLSSSGVGSAVATGTTTLPAPLEPGTYTVMARAANGVGQPVSAVTHFTIALTGAQPTVVVAQPIDGSSYTYNVASGVAAHVPVNFTATAPDGTTLDRWIVKLTKPDSTETTVPASFLSKTPTQWVGTTPLDLTVGGTYRLTVTAFNNLGDSATGTTTFNIDVVKATPVIAWPVPAPIVYGTPVTAAQFNSLALVNGAPVPGDGTYVYSPAIGTIYGVGTQTLNVAFTPADTARYNPASGSVQLIVLKAPLTVTADNKTKVYGDANPALTYKLSGFVNGETLGASGVTGTPALTTVEAGSPVGANYPITPSLGSLAAANYSFTFVDGKLEITKAPLTVSVAPATKVYGDPLPTFLFSYDVTNLRNGDTLATAFTGAPAISTAASTASVPGTYPTAPVIGSLASANYAFQFVPGTLVVTKAVLTFTATDASKAYGSPNPNFGYSVSGYRNDDTPATAYTGSPALATTATAASAVGSYPITISAGSAPAGLASDKYTFAFENATLTVTRATLIVTANDATKALNAPLPGFSATIAGFVLGDTAASAVTGAPSFSTNATQSSPIGAYDIVPALNTLQATNYTFVFRMGTLTIASPERAITGIVFLDVDGDAIRDADEIGLLGVTLQLFRNGQPFLPAITTGGAGGFTFTVPLGDPGGTFEVRVVVPAGLRRTDTGARTVTLASTDTTASVRPIGLQLDFKTLGTLNADGLSQGYWKNNLMKADAGIIIGIQETRDDLAAFTANIQPLALSPFAQVTVPGAIQIFNSKDQLSLQLLASEYNFVSGRVINGSVPLTYAFVAWGEYVLKNSTRHSERSYAQAWLDAFNNTHGGVMGGPKG